MTSQVSSILALSLIKGIGPSFIRRVEPTLRFDSANLAVGDLQGLAQLLEATLQKHGKNADASQIMHAVSRAQDIVDECVNSGIGVSTIGLPTYPDKFVGIRNPPPVVYLRGKQELLAGKVATIIGSRHATTEALAIAKRIGERFMACGYSICNGLAAGVDSAALNLDRVSPFAIGVIGSGLGKRDLDGLSASYKENVAQLLASENGLLLSTNHLGTKQSSYTAIDACTYQAALADVVVLVESSTEGGSRFTLKAAAQFSRPMGVVWRTSWDEESNHRSLNLKLIRESEASGHIHADGLAGQSPVIVLRDSRSYDLLDQLLDTSTSQIPLGL